MIDVLVTIEVVKMLAKDLHYKASGDTFYALHLLADKVDFGSSVDDLKEAYYLGLREENPPSECQINSLAVSRCPSATALDNRSLVMALYDACKTSIYTIEEAKRDDMLVAGVHAILDGVSQHLLVIKGLCVKTLYRIKDDNGTTEA